MVRRALSLDKFGPLVGPRMPQNAPELSRQPQSSQVYYSTSEKERLVQCKICHLRDMTWKHRHFMQNNTSIRLVLAWSIGSFIGYNCCEGNVPVDWYKVRVRRSYQGSANQGLAAVSIRHARACSFRSRSYWLFGLAMRGQLDSDSIFKCLPSLGRPLPLSYPFVARFTEYGVVVFR